MNRITFILERSIQHEGAIEPTGLMSYHGVAAGHQLVVIEVVIASFAIAMASLICN